MSPRATSREPDDRTAATPSGRPGRIAIAGTVGPADRCPCGSDTTLATCCLPLAITLRDGAAGRSRPGSPFDELRASSALLLWSLIAPAAIEPPVERDLSLAARAFWGTALASSGRPLAVAPSRPWPQPARRYAATLFERLWAGADAATATWLRGAVPPRLRRDPVLAELALDWLLWDAPWLRGRAAAAWILESSFLGRRRRARQTLGEILRSRPGLYSPSPEPGDGFELRERFGAESLELRPVSPPWEDESANLMVRTYRFGGLRLAGGDGFLMPSEEADRFVASIIEVNHGHDAPRWPDPRWRGWLKAWLVPLLARKWVALDGTGALAEVPLVSSC